MRSLLLAPTVVLIAAALATLPLSGSARIECATVTVTDQRMSPDPHIHGPVCGFGMTAHAPQGMDHFWITWQFWVLMDGWCGDSIYVDLNPTKVQEGSWGRIKMMFR